MTDSRTDRPRRPWLPVALLAVFLALAAAAYARTLHGEFQYDDRTIHSHGAVRAGLPGLSMIQFTQPTSRPVMVATFILSQAMGRWEPLAFHSVNLLIHLLATVALWRLAVILLRRARLPGADWAAAGTAGLFALHPLNSQAVSYIVQRGESLSTLFAVVTILLMLAVEEAERRTARLGLAAGALATFVLGVESKPTAIIAPVLWWLASAALPADAEEPLRRRVRRWLAVGSPFLLGAVVAGVALLAHVAGRSDVGFSVPKTDAWRYLLTQARATLLYLRLLLWPSGQSVDHDLPVASEVDAVILLVAVAYTFALVGSVWILVRPPRGWSDPSRAAGRVTAFGVLWWFACLAPTSSFIPVADAAVEHRAYMATFGPLLALAAVAAVLLRRLPEPWPARGGAIALLATTLPLAVALHARNAVWETELALWTDAAEKAPTKIRAVANHAFALQDAGRYEEAIPIYQRALRLEWDQAVKRTDIRDHLGSTLIKAGRPAEAIPVLLESLEDDPENVSTLNTMAIALLEMGRPADAERMALAAIGVKADFGFGFTTLGEALEAQGKLSEALAAFMRSAAIDPDVALRHLNVARVAERLGRTREACDALGAYRRARGSSADAAALRAKLPCPPDRE
jgi:tetratricopeptide (TPR) repeat protein